MKCLVTAGPTFEPLDDVRRLTNFSTGRLGTELANFLVDQGHDVTLLIGLQATWAGARRAQAQATFSTTADLLERLQAHAIEPLDAVFHAAAVSDFTFGRCWLEMNGGARVEVRAAKLPTRAGPLLAELVPTPKLLPRLRDWFPAACLVGWKYEMDGDRSAALERARQQLVEARTDACVANGRAYGAGFGLVTALAHVHLDDAPGLFGALEQLARTHPR